MKNIHILFDEFLVEFESYYPFYYFELSRVRACDYMIHLHTHHKSDKAEKSLTCQASSIEEVMLEAWGQLLKSKDATIKEIMASFGHDASLFKRDTVSMMPNLEMLETLLKGANTLGDIKSLIIHVMEHPDAEQNFIDLVKIRAKFITLIPKQYRGYLKSSSYSSFIRGKDNALASIEEYERSFMAKEEVCAPSPNNFKYRYSPMSTRPVLSKEDNDN